MVSSLEAEIEQLEREIAVEHLATAHGVALTKTSRLD